MFDHSRPCRGLSWGGGRITAWRATSIVAAFVMGAALLAPAASEASDPDPHIDIIVRAADPSAPTAQAAVEALGGSVGDSIGLIGGFTATLPASQLDALRSDRSVAAATPDGTMTLLASRFGENLEAAGYDGSMSHVLRSIGAEAFWEEGYAGSGVDVALIDSGVVAVEGLTSTRHGGRQVTNGPDLSFESQVPQLHYLDTYGHGTHMAGIIAGRDSYAPKNVRSVDDRYFQGVAPEARILNLKVAAYNGAVDVSQVLAAIDWVVQHRNDNGLNVRVLNLSFGTDSTQSYLLDPLAYAVEQAWKAGIVVVVAAGNDGNLTPLRNPAFDPFVIAVGASKTQGTETLADDTVARFSNCSATGRTVDLLAPGVSIVGLRNPGSYADTEYPSARVGTRFFRGTGTSQAAAVVSGAAALVVSKYPSATPDQVKELLRSTALETSTGEDNPCYGAGLLDLRAAATRWLPSGYKSAQSWEPSSGLGSLEASRGTDHLEHEGVVLAGEQDIFGQPFDSLVWAPLAAKGVSWSGGTWNGVSWSGDSWSGVSWSGVSWSGVSWSGVSWSGVSWSGVSWSTMTWLGGAWYGFGWSGVSWSGVSWSGDGWTGDNWLGQTWG